jgi:glycosyltransferase involved in cell wall biosynthesis
MNLLQPVAVQALTDQDESRPGVMQTKLIVVGPSPPPVHGVAMMTGELISASRALGIEVEHLDTRDPRPVTTLGRLDVQNVLFGLQHAWRLNRLLKRNKSASVHISLSQVTWGFLRDALLVVIARAWRRKLYIQLHGSHLQEFLRGSNPAMRFKIRWVLRRAHQAWALTPALCSQFNGLVDPIRVHCVENVIDDQFDGKLECARSPNDSLRLLYLSNVLPEKGCFDLVAALRELGQRSASWEVRIVGAAAPEVEKRLRCELAELPAGSAHISLMGERRGQEKQDQYKWANAFVFPPRQDEGQPLVLLEAMCAGLPIVATNQRGIADTVRHGEEGLLFERHDVLGLAKAITELADNPELSEALGRAGRRRYEQMYRPERLIRDLSQLLA